MMRKIIFILVVCLVALSSCQWDGKSGNTADVDVRVARYDRLQYEYVTMNSFSALQKMNTDYPQVTKLLIEDVLAIGELDEQFPVHPLCILLPLKVLFLRYLRQ